MVNFVLLFEETDFQMLTRFSSIEVHRQYLTHVNFLEKAYPKVEDLVDMDDASKESDKRKEVINDYFYRNDENFDYIYNFAQNGWKPDYDTLDITEADEDNIYVWQMSFKNKDGKKVGSLMGNYYDYVDSIDIIECGLTNQGAINAYDHSLSDYSKGGKK